MDTRSNGLVQIIKVSFIFFVHMHVDVVYNETFVEYGHCEVTRSLCTCSMCEHLSILYACRASSSHTAPLHALKVLSYYIILFPSLDVVSVYPLLVLTIVNNLYTVIFCKDTSQVTNSWGTFFVRLLLKFIISLAPILVAMAISNLFVVLCWFNGFLHLLFHTHFSSTTVQVGVQTNLLQCCPICG